METLLLIVGIFVLIVTIYGAVMAGGEALERSQMENLADDIEVVVQDNGVEVLAGVDPQCSE